MTEDNLAAKLQAKLDRIKDCVENEKHYNEECGWDVPAISILNILEEE